MVDDQHTAEEIAYNAGYEDGLAQHGAAIDDAYDEGYYQGQHDAVEAAAIEAQFDRLVELLREEHYKHHNSHAMKFCENEICMEATL